VNKNNHHGIMALGDLLSGFSFFFFFSSFVPHLNGQNFEKETGAKHKEHHANKNDATDNNACSTIRGIFI
jgi:hypothetical protein